MLGGHMEKRSAIGRSAQAQLFRMLVEQGSERGHIALTCSLDESAVEGERVDVGFKGAPAWEAVLLGQIELGFGELCAGIGFAQLFQAALGLLAQPVKVGVFREREWSSGHGNLPFLFSSAPAVRSVGEE